MAKIAPSFSPLAAGGFVTARGGAWLPGSYATVEAAQFASEFEDEQLSALQKKIAPEYITLEMLHVVKQRGSYE